MGTKRSSRQTRLALPESTDRAEKVQRRFKSIARLMRESRATRLDPSRSSRRPNERFKKSAYKLIAHYVENEFHHTFALVLSELGRIPKTSIQPDDNPFFWGLVAICGDETIFSMNQLRRIAMAMHRGYELEIPPDQILEFLRRPPSE